MRKSCIIWLNCVIALATIIISSAQAQAFYWYGWPGSGVPPDRVIVGPPGSSGSPPRVPVGNPVVVTTPPPGGGSGGTEPTGGSTTPEPATGLAAISVSGPWLCAAPARQTPDRFKMTRLLHPITRRSKGLGLRASACLKCKPDHLRVAAKPNRFTPAQSAANQHRYSILLEDPSIESAAVNAGNKYRTDQRYANGTAVNVSAEDQTNIVSLSPIEVVWGVAQTESE